MAKEVDKRELAKNEFWRRKIRRVVDVRDVNKDGFISRADFLIIAQRYKDMGCSEHHFQVLKRCFEGLCETLGLVDENSKVTYEEHIERFAESDTKIEDLTRVFSIMFDSMDSDGNGVISYKEWVDHQKALGVDTKHARASFDAMDADKDGIISKDEFFEYNKEFYYSVEDKLKSSIMYGPLD